MWRWWGVGACGVLVLTSVACNEATIGGASRVSIHVTDAPAPAASFAAATVDIGAIQLIPEDGEPITITEDAGQFDLLQLQNGVTAALASADVPAGRYLQMRLAVRGASVTLTDGHGFADGSTTQDLFVPSGAQSGIKINLFGTDWTMGVADSGRAGAMVGNPDRARARNGRSGMGSDHLERRTGVEIIPGETIIVLDFDVGRNFILTGPPAAPNGALFKPLIRAVVRDVAGSVSGSVVDADGQPVAGATVQAVLVDSPVLESLQTAAATAQTADDGSYTIWFLAPGTYTVSVEGYENLGLTVQVGESQDVSGVDFHLTS
jgi:hypothetical protein